MFTVLAYGMKEIGTQVAIIAAGCSAALIAGEGWNRLVKGLKERAPWQPPPQTAPQNPKDK